MLRSSLDRELQEEKSASRAWERKDEERQYREAKDDLAISKDHFLRDTSTHQKDVLLFALSEKIEGIFDDQKALNHLRTRWGLKYFVTYSEEAAANFDKDPRPNLLEGGDTIAEKGDQIARAANHSYGIHFRTLNGGEWINYTLKPLKYGNEVSFDIDRRSDDGRGLNSIGPDVRNEEDIIKFVRDVMKTHIEEQRKLSRVLPHVGSAVAATALVVATGIGTLGQNPREFNF